MDDDSKYLASRIDRLENDLRQLREEGLGKNPASAVHLAELKGEMGQLPSDVRKLDERVHELQFLRGLEPRLARVERQLDALLEMLAKRGLDCGARGDRGE
jgi:hypothetical protein